MFTESSRIIVVAADPALEARSRQIAAELDLKYSGFRPLDAEIFLVVEAQDVYLQTSEKNSAPVRVDFATGKSLHRRKFGGGINQPLAKAIGLKKYPYLHVLDATGGFARDAFVLASLGARLTIVEQSSVLCLLIKSAIDMALQDKEVAPIVRRMAVFRDNSVDFLRRMGDKERPDVVYLDPMYPPRQKSAAVKKDMQLLHSLIGSNVDSAPLLDGALDVAKKRVVVKRPLNAAPLKVNHLAGSIKSTNTRYDIYTPRRQ